MAQSTLQGLVQSQQRGFPGLLLDSWNLKRLFSTVLVDKQTAINWCRAVGLIPNEVCCPSCRRVMAEYPSQAERLGSDTCIGIELKCNKSSCRKSVSLAKGTFFENSHISIEKVLVIIYCFAFRFDYDGAIREASLPVNLTSPETVADYVSFFI